MVDLSQFWSVGGLAVLVAALIQVAKLGPLGADACKPWIPYIAMALGITLSVVIGWGLVRMGTPADKVSAVLGGLLAGLVATGFYQATIDPLKKAAGL